MVHVICLNSTILVYVLAKYFIRPHGVLGIVVIAFVCLLASL